MVTLPLAAETDSTAKLPTSVKEAVVQNVDRGYRGLRHVNECPAVCVHAVASISRSPTDCPATTSLLFDADGDQVWVGTDDGLALIDKPSQKVTRVWQEKDGLPWRVITGIDVDPKTGDVWLALFGKGLARLSGGRFDHFHQLNSGLVNDVVYASHD